MNFCLKIIKIACLIIKSYYNPNKGLKVIIMRGYPEEVNNIALSTNDDKTLQTFDNITTYPYGSNAFKVRENEMMIVKDFFVKNYADCPFYDEIILQQR